MTAAAILGWKISKYYRPILHNSKSPETPRKLFLEIIKTTERKKYVRGASTCPRGWGRALPPWARPLPCGPPGGPPVAIFSDETPPPRGGTLAEPWWNQSRALAELFCQGNFPPGGGNHRHRHHQRSSHRERAISINIFTRTISSQTLVHLLYPILVSKSGIGTCTLLVLLITPCS